MTTILPKIDEKDEVEKITQFVQKTLDSQSIQNVVIGISGGVDSSTALALVTQAIPLENIYTIHLPYFASDPHIEELLATQKILPTHQKTLSIRESVDKTVEALGIEKGDENSEIRIGNIAARIRMIALFDFAKKINGLVCGTENKSEYYLGYFTRFGDEASDIEFLRHLYKSQVYDLAAYLHIPQAILEKSPTAGLWQGQTDEGEFGFSYEEADSVLYLHYEEKLSVSDIEKRGFIHTRDILAMSTKNTYKHKTPYVFTQR